MELRFCDECGSRISEDDFASGKAVASDDFCYCPRCYRKKQKQQKKKQKQQQLAAPAGVAEKPKPKPKPASTTRLKRATPGGGGTPGSRVHRDTPATAKLPARSRKTRPSTSKMPPPAPRHKRPSSGRLEQLGEVESEAADWGRTIFNGIMLLIGGLLLGYLGFMLLRRQGGAPVRKPVGGNAAPTPSPSPGPAPEQKPMPGPESKPSPQADR